MPFEKFQWYFFIVFLAAVVLLSVSIARPFFSVLALAAITAVILEPLYRQLHSRVRGPRLAAAILIILVLLVILIPAGFLFRQIATEAASMYEQLSLEGWGDFSLVVGRFEALLPATPWSNQLNVPQYIGRLTSWVVNHAGALLASTFSVSWKILFWILALYYFLKDGPKFYHHLVHLSPLADHDDISIAQELKSTVRAVVAGALLIAVIQGALVGLGFTIFGLPHGALWGTVGAFAALIPGVGTSLVLIPGILTLWWQGGAAGAVGLLIWGILMVGLIDNILAPVLYSRGSKLHPLLVLIAVIGGLGFFGPSGFILGPVTFSLLIALLHIYRERLLKS